MQLIERLNNNICLHAGISLERCLCYIVGAEVTTGTMKNRQFQPYPLYK